MSNFRLFELVQGLPVLSEELVQQRSAGRVGGGSKTSSTPINIRDHMAYVKGMAGQGR